MKIGPGIRHIFLGMALLLCAPVEYAAALTFLSRTKDVTIDAEWRVTGHYTCEYEISHPQDVRKINQIFRQFQNQTNPSSKTDGQIRLPDGRHIPWETDGGNDLPAGTTVGIKSSIVRAFAGFQGLFADFMQIDQDTPIKTVNYRITFPRKTNFIWRITQNDKKTQNTELADSFTWSGKGITRFDIMLSTAASWEQIAHRYQALFQSRLGTGVTGCDYPATLRGIDASNSAHEKIRAVMRFLNDEFTYRQSPEPAHHALLPDTPADVLSRRWGDCKDFALLAAALLQKMDIETSIVLAGTPRSNRPGKAIPDPFIFDHALIGYRQNGRTDYYDCLLPGNTVTVNDYNVYLSLKVFNNLQ